MQSPADSPSGTVGSGGSSGSSGGQTGDESQSKADDKTPYGSSGGGHAYGSVAEAWVYVVSALCVLATYFVL